MSAMTEVEKAAPEQVRASRGSGWRAPRRAPRRGALAEPALVGALDELADQGWTVLDDLAWPGRWATPVPHVLVGPGGVVVMDVDAQPWRLADDSTLRLGRRVATRACLALSQRTADVASLLRGPQQDAVYPVLCLTTRPLPAVLVEHGVTAAGPSGLWMALQQLPVVLDAVDISEISAQLAHHLARRPEAADAGGAVLGLVPAQRTPVDHAASAAAPVFAPWRDKAVERVVPTVTEPPASPVFATRREAIAAERKRRWRLR